MKKSLKVLALLLTAALMAGLLGACGSTSASTAASAQPSASAASGADSLVSTTANDENVAKAMATPADKLVIAVDDDSFSVGPFASDSAVRDWTQSCLWGTLAYRPFIGAMLDAGELQNVMAKTITKVDDTTYDIVLYDNITDSKGNNIKASDVVFSFDKLKELGYVSYINTYYDSGEVVGDYELKLHLTSGNEGAIELLLVNGTVCSQKWYEGATEDEIMNDPACTGPYEVTDMQTGATATFQARDYWKADTETKSLCELQNVKTITIKCITEASMRSIALENGEVDLAEVSASEISRFESNDAYTVKKYLNSMNTYMIYNCSADSVCSDIRVRQAIAYALDAWTMFLGNGNDQGQLLHDVCPNTTPDYVKAWDEENYYPQDLTKCKELLTEAGYSDSNKLKIRFLCCAQAPSGPYEAFQAMMLAAGIDCELNTVDRAVLNTTREDSTAWDVTEYSESVSDFTTTYWTSMFDDANYAHGTQGFTEDPKLQELLDAACADRSEANLNAFHKYYYDNCYMLGLYTEYRTIAAQSGVSDIFLVNGNLVPQAVYYTDTYTSVAK